MRNFYFVIFLFFCLSAVAQSSVQQVPAWKLYYDSTQVFWNKDWNRTLPLLVKAEQYALIDLGIYDENYAIIVGDLGLAWWHVKDYRQAEKYLKRAIDLKRESSSGKTRELYGLMNNLAGLYAEQAQWSDAVHLYKSVLSQDPVVDTVVYNSSLQNMLGVYDAGGHPDSVLRWLLTERMAAYRAQQPDRLLSAALDLAAVKAYRELRRYGEAENLAGTLLTRLQDERHVTLFARALQEKGLLDLETGQYARAEKDMLRAYHLLKANAVTDASLLTTVLNNLAYVYDKMNIDDKALLFYEESLSICRENNSDDSLPCITLQSNIAGIYLKQNNIRRAIQAYELLLQNIDTSGESLMLYLTAQNNLATAYRNNGEFARAAAHLRLAHDLIQKNNLDHGDIAATVLNNFAVLNTTTGNLSQAITYAEEAYAIKKAIYGEQSVLLLDLISNLGILYWAQHDQGRAIPLLQRSMQLSLRQVKYVFPTLNGSEQIQFYKRLKDDFERFNTVACQSATYDPDMITQMFNNQVAIKSLVFFTQQRAARQVLEQNDSSITRAYRELRSRREQIGYYYQLSQRDLQQRGISIKALELEIDQLEKEIAIKTSDIPDNGMAKTMGWNDVQQGLGHDEALVDIIRFRKYDITGGESRARLGFTDSIYYAALVTTAETREHPAFVLLKEGNNMETRFFNYYKNALTFEVADENSYSFFWQPFENLLREKKKVFFSGDGIYYKINLNTLSANGLYLLERYDIHQLLNPCQFLSKKAPVASSTAVLIGDPLFDADLSGAYRSKADSVTQFGALPGTMAEIKAIENILHTNHWKTSVLLKGNATERNLKKIRSPDILHIATHGFFSAEFVSLNEEAKKDFLFHSGIVLSGANRQTERETTPFRDDGIVTAYEVMNLDLSQTELVVLSACETGLGKIENGEGVYGLQRSFLQAGARNVMISLWKVDDVYTKDLMIKFYAYFSRGFPKHESLKLAQLEQMKHVSDPKHWGGFILIGVD